MALIATGSLLICYALWLLRGLVRWRKALELQLPPESSSANLEILLPFRNEGDWLIELIENLQQQISSAKNTRLILIDDHSENELPEKIRTLFGAESNIVILQNGLDSAGKKAALALGFRQCSGDWVVQLDADARLGPDWLLHLRKALSADTDLALLPVMVTPGNHWFSGIEYCEMLSLQAITAGSANAGNPLLANGTGLAVRHSIMAEFLNAGVGREYASGDDQFLLQFAKDQGWNVKWIPEEDLIVRIQGVGSLKDFVSQRLRWAGKMKASPSGASFLEGLLLSGFHLAFVVIGLSLALTLPGILLILLFSKVLLDLVFLYTVSGFFGITRRLPFFAIMSSICYPFIQPMIAIGSVFLNPKWKGRPVKQ